MCIRDRCKNKRSRTWCQERRQECKKSGMKKNCAATCRTKGCCGDLFPTARCKKATKGKEGKTNCETKPNIKKNCRRSCAAKLGKKC